MLYRNVKPGELLSHSNYPDVWTAQRVNKPVILGNANRLGIGWQVAEVEPALTTISMVSASNRE